MFAGNHNLGIVIRHIAAAMFLFALCFLCHAQSSSSKQSSLALTSVDTNRFVAVHGRRSLVMGYPQTGLELWAYPFQIFSGYQVAFRPEGSAAEIDGRLLLKRVIQRPDSVTRIYTGPDYVIRETIFVPLARPAAIITYNVDSDRTIYIDVKFKPVLNLMWPGAVGGQSISWDSHLKGYLLEEPAHHLRALIASPQLALHDDTVNSTLHASGKLSFALKPQPMRGGDAEARVYVAMLDSPSADPGAMIESLQSRTPDMENASRDHYADLAEGALRISTPDKDVNSALAWAEVALDQAWVCNPQLGCGIVAGYGPSRGARRPQYAWFFAGDGLVAVNALVSVGEYNQARDELLFIEKYQDPKTGMIWHELSQSAGYIDWSKYPYMFVHVDISFDYLNAIAHYVLASGDNRFAEEHWKSIDAAYHYCRSLIGDDGLPHIPAGKEGADEQHRPVEDLGLSANWVAAAKSYAALAKAAGHPQLAGGAIQESQRAREAIAAHSWDSAHRFWINGTSADGQPIFTRRSGPSDAITQNIFSPRQNDDLLNQIASSTFRTDWGVRSVGTNSTIYNPWSYASGSVSALHSSQIAAMFWAEDRPEIAWSTWRSIVPWSRLDSLGHIHEVLAGNYYRPQTESVPEQTWSSAGLLDAAVRGLLGLTILGAQHRVIFRPHLPATWDQVSVGNIHLPQSTLVLTMRQTIDSGDLAIDNNGAPITLLFQPEIPLGAQLTGLSCNGHAVEARSERFDEDEHAKAQITVPSGVTHCRLRFSGGVSVIFPPAAPKVGNASTEPKLTSLTLDGKVLVMHLEVNGLGDNIFTLRTPWKVSMVTGASLLKEEEHSYIFKIGASNNGGGYSPLIVRATLTE